MSERRPRKPSDRKPTDRKASDRTTEKKAAPTPADDLPELEPIDAEGLETLAPVDELEPIDADGSSPVRVSCKPTDETGFDTCIEIDVPEMEKKAVADAVAGPLRRCVAEAAAAVRHRRIALQFSGPAMIGTAVKDLVGEILKAQKALKVVVRRGYGDETVHEGKLPQARVSTRADGNTARVEVDASGLEAADLPVALATELEKLAATANGKAFTFAFTGTARPDASVRARIRDLFAAAGATRVAIGDAVLFDRELEARVCVTVDGDQRNIAIAAADDETVTLAAMALVLHPADFGKRRVLATFTGHVARARERKALLELCQQSRPERFELDRGKDSPDVLWPLLLEATVKDGETVLLVHDHGRDRSAVIAAFRREVDAHQKAIAGKPVTIDWPAGFVVDATVERECLAGLGALAPKAIACSVAGEHKEPFLPLPVSFAKTADGGRNIRIDTDAGKPPELARAIERRLLASGADLRGHPVYVEIAGAGAASRTMLRTLASVIERAGASRLTIDDHGHVDVMLPLLLRITKDDNVVQITAGGDDGGRDATQIEHALQRELDAAEIPAGAVFTVAPSPLADAIIAAAVARLASRVLLDGHPQVQVHPALLAVQKRDGKGLTVRATPGTDAAVTSAQIARELPPLLAAVGDLASAAVTVIWPLASDPHAEPLATLLRELTAANPRQLQLDDGAGRVEQVFPVVVRTYVTVLGKKDGATPPLLMLGIGAGSGDEHKAAVLGRLQEIAASIDGRAVLLLLRQDGRDAACPDADPLFVEVRAFVDQRAAATLCFRGRDAARQPWFEVVHSTAASLAVGSRVADPRRLS